MADGLISYTIAPDGARRFTNADLARMVERGLIDPDDRWELIRGEWFDMPSEGDLHTYVRFQVQRAFMTALGPEWFCGTEMSLFLRDDTELRPDLAVFPMRPDIRSVPGHEIAFIAEIMDSSHTRDRDHKLPIYGETGVAEVWLIDLVKRGIEIYRRGSDRSLVLERVADFDEAMSPQAFVSVSIRGKDFLP